MDYDSIRVSCRKCKRSFKIINGILQHISNSQCKEFYTEYQVSRLQEHKDDLSKAKKKAKDDLWYQRNKASRAKNYKKNRVQISLDNHNKNSGKPSYDKEARKQKYQEVKAVIAQKRKELIDYKESEPGKHFYRLCYREFENVYDEITEDHINSWLEKIRDEEQHIYYSDAMDYVFEKQAWASGLGVEDCDEILFPESLSCNEAAQVPASKDSEVCLQHMDESQLYEKIEISMEKECNEVTEKLMLKAAKDKVNQEWKLAFEVDSFDCLPRVYKEVAKNVCNKAFKTIFLEQYMGIYDIAYGAAMDKVMLTEHIFDYDDYNFNKKMDSIFYNILIEELEASDEPIATELAKLFRWDFVDAVKKKFSFFKENIPIRIRSANARRKKWALKKVKEIEKIVESIDLDQSKKDLLKDAHIKIQDIYKQYDDDITFSYKQYEFEFKYFCFTCIVKWYPKLDYKYEVGDINYELKMDDNYGVLIKKLWVQLEVEERKCACIVCTENPKGSRVYSCSKVVWQKYINRPYRTCPIYQLNISTEEFDGDGHFQYKTDSWQEYTCIDEGGN